LFKGFDEDEDCFFFFLQLWTNYGNDKVLIFPVQKPLTSSVLGYLGPTLIDVSIRNMKRYILESLANCVTDAEKQELVDEISKFYRNKFYRFIGLVHSKKLIEREEEKRKQGLKVELEYKLNKISEVKFEEELKWEMLVENPKDFFTQIGKRFESGLRSFQSSFDNNPESDATLIEHPTDHFPRIIKDLECSLRFFQSLIDFNPEILLKKELFVFFKKFKTDEKTISWTLHLEMNYLFYYYSHSEAQVYGIKWLAGQKQEIIIIYLLTYRRVIGSVPDTRVNEIDRVPDEILHIFIHLFPYFKFRIGMIDGKHSIISNVEEWGEKVPPNVLAAVSSLEELKNLIKIILSKALGLNFCP
jgi:tetratricopeptide (TPR) repeat protein